jgi:transposase-like protein
VSGERSSPKPPLVMAQAVAEVLAGMETPKKIAAKYGIDTKRLSAWQRAAEDDPELAAMVRASFARLVQGWRPEIRVLLREVAAELRRRLREKPDAISVSELVGTLTHLGGLLSTADPLARRAGLDGEEEPLPLPPGAPRPRGEELDS